MAGAHRGSVLTYSWDPPAPPGPPCRLGVSSSREGPCLPLAPISSAKSLPLAPAPAFLPRLTPAAGAHTASPPPPGLLLLSRRTPPPSPQAPLGSALVSLLNKYPGRPRVSPQARRPGRQMAAGLGLPQHRAPGAAASHPTSWRCRARRGGLGGVRERLKGPGCVHNSQEGAPPGTTECRRPVPEVEALPERSRAFPRSCDRAWGPWGGQ